MEESKEGTLDQEETPISIELRHPRNIALVEEFKIKPPTTGTYNEAVNLVRRGMPFLKSIGPNAFEHLLIEGNLVSQAIREGEGLEVIYASVIHNKGYGPLTVIFKPEVMRRGSYIAFAIDHASTYMTKQLRERADVIVASGIALNRHEINYKDLEKQLLDERYKLSPEEFKELYAYILASFTDHPINTHTDHKTYEELQRFITFDIGFPVLRLEDTEELVYKQDWGGQAVDIERLSGLAQAAGKSIVTIPKVPGTYEQEKLITRDLIARYEIPEKFRSAINKIA